jgi:His/Glu/Gln/Arg/opine family amino acid ABC transporter permease subunit
MSFDWSRFFEALTSDAYVKGAFIAVVLAFLAQAMGILVGFVVALGRGSRFRYLRTLSAGYVWIFRAVPALLLLLLVWNALPQLFAPLQQPWFSPFLAALLGLTLMEGALMAEILRSALGSIDPGQRLAGRALGFSPVQVMRHILVPQMIRVAIPPTGNEYVNMVKITSLASVISLQELLTAAARGVASTFSYAEYYSAALVYYLVIVSAFMVLQSRLERRYHWKSSSRARTPRWRRLGTRAATLTERS